ncbi:MAG: acyl carrier protein [Candidatus Obscuribacterales bacterium]|nr:acyl carrier protein [Candidatus Obscuribacterales bacterium]
MSQRDKLIEAYVEALEIPKDSNFESLEFRSIKEWNSVAHIRLIAEIETMFDVMLSTDDVLNLSSFSKSIEILETHGVKFDA